jgi:hypothetical protein
MLRWLMLLLVATLVQGEDNPAPAVVQQQVAAPASSSAISNGGVAPARVCMAGILGRISP